MRIEVDVQKWYDWKLTPAHKVAADDIALPSHHGDDFRMVRQLQPEPSVTYIEIPDSDIDRMLAEHREGVDQLRRGYTCVHEGGPQHGATVIVPPRAVREKSLDELIAYHLEEAVLPFHADLAHISSVRVIEGHHSYPEKFRARLEKYLNARFALAGGAA